MSWLDRLYNTYESAQKNDANRPSPVCHGTQNAHVEITINGEGEFISSKVIDKKDAVTLIPVTEDSATRSGQCAPHPLCDSVQNVAGDFTKYVDDKSYFEDFSNKKETQQGYKSLLSDWCANFPTKMNFAVLKYVSKKTVIEDLIKDGVLFTDENGKLLNSWNGEQKEKPKIFEVCQNPNNPFIRWKVEIPGHYEDKVWEDEELFQSWINYDSSPGDKNDICFVSGEEARITKKHPAKIRNSGDKTKIISSNDNSNFTFKGRFKEAEQAAGVSYEVSQKAHAALRWLIERGQAFSSDSLCIVSWDVGGRDIPSLYDVDEFGMSESSVPIGDMGQAYSKQLKIKLAGYSVKLKDSKNIEILGLDSSGGSTGRLAIVYYREMTGSDFLKRLETWHEDFAWFQKGIKKKDKNDPKSKDAVVEFRGAPSFKSIVFAAYGSKVDDKLEKATIKRLLPCEIEGQRMPFDLVESTFRRVVNRVSMGNFEWGKSLGVFCSLFKGYHKGRGYQMGLDTGRKTRDYLFGRLLAVAQKIEEISLWASEKNRETSAERYMQRFSTHPCSTWLIIQKSLASYKQRLRASEMGSAFLNGKEKVIEEICCSFNADEFSDDKPLTGEFLLGYHCQMHEFRPKDKNTKQTEEETKDESEQES